MAVRYGNLLSMYYGIKKLSMLEHFRIYFLILSGAVGNMIDRLFPEALLLICWIFVEFGLLYLT